VSNFGDTGNIGQPQHRISGGLQPDQARFRADGGFDRFQVGRFHKIEQETVAGQYFVEEAEGSAVNIITTDNMIAGFEQAHQRINRGHA
jgi:hypothetical protein